MNMFDETGPPLNHDELEELMASLRERVNVGRDAYGHILLASKCDAHAFQRLVQVIHNDRMNAKLLSVEDPITYDQMESALIAFMLRRIFWRHQPITTNN